MNVPIAKASAANFLPEETVDNARLIAAAPDLLAALELARTWMVYRANADDLAVVEAAIAKAKGEA